MALSNTNTAPASEGPSIAELMEILQSPKKLKESLKAYEDEIKIARLEQAEAKEATLKLKQDQRAAKIDIDAKYVQLTKDIKESDAHILKISEEAANRQKKAELAESNALAADDAVTIRQTNVEAKNKKANAALAEREKGVKEIEKQLSLRVGDINKREADLEVREAKFEEFKLDLDEKARKLKQMFG